jgi:hypothetical protein
MVTGEQSMSMKDTNHVAMVFGDGSAAVHLVNELVNQGRSVIWSEGSGARLSPVMPYVKSELALGVLLHSAKSEALIADAITTAAPMTAEKGTFHRVFRNKAFKLGTWKKGYDLVVQQTNFENNTWKPEQAFLGVTEFRIANSSPLLIEQNIRVSLAGHPLVRKIASAPITEVEVYEKGGTIQFANGEVAAFSEFFFCDSISELKSVPKLAGVFKHQLGNVKMNSRMSAVQVTFQHSVALKQKIETGLVIPMNRDSGETFDRDVLGYFLNDTTSVWTVFMQTSETEENHEIMKKIRKLKQSLNRAFDNPEFLPEGSKEFMATVEKELVRFEEGYLVTEGKFKSSEANHDFVLLTDSFGLTHTLEKIGERFGIAAVDMTTLESSASENAAEAVAEFDSESDFPTNLDRPESPAHEESILDLNP